MFGLKLIAVLSVVFFGSTECAINGWTSGGGTAGGTDVTDTSCASVTETGTVSFTVTATTDAATVIGYAIQAQPTGLTGTYTFAVTNMGAVTLASGTLDHEADGTMIVVIRATDNTMNTGDLTCTLTVTDINEAAPDFTLNYGCLSFDNNLAAASAITTIVATDADTSQTVTLALDSGNTGTAFTFTPGTGALVVAGSALTTGSYSLVFTGTDNGSPSMMTGTTTLTVNINTECPTDGAVVMAISTLALMASLLAFLG